MGGESLRTICADANMPSRTTVIRWQTENAEFGAKCARAREEQAHAIFEEIQEVADKGNPDDVQRAKLRVSTMQWRAAKLLPKVYGDKVEVDLNAKIESEDTGALLAELSRALGVSVDEARKMVGFAPGENAG